MARSLSWTVDANENKKKVAGSKKTYILYSIEMLLLFSKNASTNKQSMETANPISDGLVFSLIPELENVAPIKTKIKPIKTPFLVVENARIYPLLTN